MALQEERGCCNIKKLTDFFIFVISTKRLRFVSYMPYIIFFCNFINCCMVCQITKQVNRDYSRYFIFFFFDTSIASFKLVMSRLYDASSISTKNGVAPDKTIASAVAAYVNDGQKPHHLF